MVIAARDLSRLEEAAKELSTTAAPVTPLVCDTGSKPSVDEMVAAVVARFGRIDILINCAAPPATAGPHSRLAEITEDMVWTDLNVKVMGYLRCMQAVVPHMVAAGGGRIVNVGGLAARQTGSTVHSIRNASVAAITKNAADELGRHGISVIAVHPNPTRTERSAELIHLQAAREGTSEAEITRRLAARNVLGRLIEATEVAHVIVFLASPKAVAINGDAVITGGGVPGAIHY